jgi:hypothetical protein
MDWYPAKLFDDWQPERPYALLILNQPLNLRTYERVAHHGMQQPNSKESPLIFAASMIVCVDGGANQLYTILEENKDLPHKVSQAGRIS